MPSNNDLFNIWLRKQLTAADIAGATTPDGVAATDRTVTLTLNAATTTTNGTTADFGQVVSNSVAVGTSSATLTAGNIVIEGSIDNSRWFPLQTINLTDFNAGITTVAYPQIAKPLRYIRTRVSVAPTGGNISMRVAASTGS